MQVRVGGVPCRAAFQLGLAIHKPKQRASTRNVLWQGSMLREDGGVLALQRVLRRAMRSEDLDDDLNSDVAATASATEALIVDHGPPKSRQPVPRTTFPRSATPVGRTISCCQECFLWLLTLQILRYLYQIMADVSLR